MTTFCQNTPADLVILATIPRHLFQHIININTNKSTWEDPNFPLPDNSHVATKTYYTLYIFWCYITFWWIILFSVSNMLNNLCITYWHFLNNNFWEGMKSIKIFTIYTSEAKANASMSWYTLPNVVLLIQYPSNFLFSYSFEDLYIMQSLLWPH